MKLEYYEKWKSSALSLAETYSGSGNHAQAEVLLRKLLSVRPQDADCRVKLVEVLSRSQDPAPFRLEGLFLVLMNLPHLAPEDRLKLLTQLLEKYPQDLNLKLKAAESALSLNRLEVAEPLFVGLAEFYQSKSLPLNAISMYERILETNPEKVQFLHKIAEIYVREGIFDKAIDRYFKLAQHYLDRGMLQESAATFEQILAIDPINEKACIPLAKICLLQNDLQGASKVMHKQIENSLNKGRIQEAADLSESFVELLIERNYPKEANQEREQMARALLSRGKTEKALPLFAAVAAGALLENDLEKFINLSTIEIKHHAAQDNVQKLTESYEKMILTVHARDKEKAGSLLEDFIRHMLKQQQIAALDRSLRNMARTVEEEKSFDEAEKLLMRLGDVYASLYRSQEAIRVYESIVHRGSETPEAYVRLGDLYAQEENLPRAMDLYMKSMELCASSSQVQRAEQIFEAALKKDSKNPSLLAKMGYVYYSIGEWDKALDFYQQALTLDSYHRQAVVGMAMTYAKKGMLDEMVQLAKRLVTKGLIAEIVEEYRKALSLTCSPSECSVALGILYKDLGFMEEAIIEFQNASKDPKILLKAYKQIGLCFKAQGFSNLAIRQLQKALQAEGYSEEETLEVRYHLAVTYEDVNMVREACDLYNDILVLDIAYKDVKERLRHLKNLQPKGKVVSFDRGGEGRKS